MSTYVIAEAAACHDGDLRKAKRLIYLAGRIGANAIKFQYLSSPERLAERRRAPEYLEHYRLLSFPREWFPALVTACNEVGVEFLCTSYLPEDIAIVAPHVKRFKVSSFESGDAHFVGLHAEWPDTPLILSAGMGDHTAESVTTYLNLVRHRTEVGLQSTISVLYCVSAYPTPDDQINLAVLRYDRYTFSYRSYAGLSDHTRHPWTGGLAVAAGARIVEFHVRLDDTLETNADYAVSRTPAEAQEYVRNIRQAEIMLGSGIREVQPAEHAMLRYRVGIKEAI